jgi:hypothetical protein
LRGSELAVEDSNELAYGKNGGCIIHRNRVARQVWFVAYSGLR